jgi:hypothetical protein
MLKHDLIIFLIISIVQVIYDEFSKIAAHPVKDPEVFWSKQAVIDYVLLFIDQNDVTLKMPLTEQDFLEDMFGFIKESKRLTGTTCVTYDQMHYSICF